MLDGQLVKEVLRCRFYRPDPAPPRDEWAGWTSRMLIRELDPLASLSFSTRILWTITGQSETPTSRDLPPTPLDLAALPPSDFPDQFVVPAGRPPRSRQQTPSISHWQPYRARLRANC